MHKIKFSDEQQELIDIMPHELYKGKNLSDSELLMLAQIVYQYGTEYAQQNGNVYKSDRDMMNVTGLSINTIGKARKGLQLKGFISFIPGKIRGRQATVYTLSDWVCELIHFQSVTRVTDSKCDNAESVTINPQSVTPEQPKCDNIEVQSVTQNQNKNQIYKSDSSIVLVPEENKKYNLYDFRFHIPVGEENPLEVIDDWVSEYEKGNSPVKELRVMDEVSSIEVMGMWKMLVLQRYGSELYFQTLHLWEDINDKYQNKHE